jgi:probable DNA repair protein
LTTQRETSAATLHLTVNSRLTQFLKAEFMLQQAKQQTAHVIVTPQVMTWGQWWESWQQAQLLRGVLPLESLPEKILSDFEAQSIWQALLDEACEADDLLLLNPAQTAKQLYQAWQYDCEYLTGQFGDDIFQGQYLTEETQLYLRLKSRYQQLMSKANLWDASLLMQQRLQWFKDLDNSVLAVQLHGFDDLTPYMKSWLQMVKAKGGQVALAQPETSSESVQQWYVASDESDEAKQAALWAYQCYKTLSAQTKIPPRIAIVAPDISEVEASLIWTLDEQLFLHESQPLKLFQTQAKPSPFYNVSLGKPLAEVPLVKNALSVLEFAISHANKGGEAAKFSYNQVSEWLVSPYTPGDFVQRQALDFGLRSWQWAELSIAGLLASFKRVREQAPEENGLRLSVKPPKALMDSLYALTQPGRFLNEKGGKSLTAHAFYQAALNVLDSSGWANSGVGGSLNSVEFQQKQALLKALHQFSQQWLVTGSVQAGHEALQMKSLTAVEWLGKLRQFVAEQLHQPESVSGAPIQIMGMLEAGGQSFDALWVMGMTASAWPREARPNPFLPMALQREHQLPRADVGRELHYAQALTERLSSSAQHVVWSYAKQTQGQLNLISPLIDKKEQVTANAYAPQGYQTLAENLFNQRRPLEWVEDAKAPEVPLGEKVPGGSAILTAQSKCPLMAFFDYRLGAKYQLETVEPGLRSNHLGTLVHLVLENFWQEVKTQKRLLAMDESALQQKIDLLLDDAMSAMSQHFNAHYLSLEKKRIGLLLQDWLALEKQRPAFELLASEQDIELDLAGLKLSIKIDRIDRMADDENALIVLDYKTGKASLGDLMKMPLKAPQLAVYLHAFEGKTSTVKGLGYGMIHSDTGIDFSVVAESEDFLPDAYKNKQVNNFAKLSAKEGSDYDGASWNDFIDHLKQAVWQLAEEVQQGRADLHYEKVDDLQYAASLLALRLPEAKRFLVDTPEESEAVS